MTRRCSAAAAILLAVVTAGAEPTSRPAGPTTRPADVRTVADVAYYTGEDADPEKHRLDLYLPEGRRGVPVLMYVHGGSWRRGDRRLYRLMGRQFAAEGVATVIISYRLSPAVKHPAHIKDVARAFAWVHRHIAAYGGRPDRIFIMGHSAGGHLVSLLASDESYLKAHGLSASAIRGVIAVNGVYRIPASGGRRLFRRAFPPDAAVRRDASPMTHVRKDAPPFLILSGERDLAALRDQAARFEKALTAAGAQARLLEVPHRSHASIVVRLLLPHDAAREAILRFVRDQSK